MGGEKQAMGQGRKDNQCTGHASPTSANRDVNAETPVWDPLDQGPSRSPTANPFQQVHPKALPLRTEP